MEYHGMGYCFGRKMGSIWVVSPMAHMADTWFFSGPNEILMGSQWDVVMVRTGPQFCLLIHKVLRASKTFKNQLALGCVTLQFPWYYRSGMVRLQVGHPNQQSLKQSGTKPTGWCLIHGQTLMWALPKILFHRISLGYICYMLHFATCSLGMTVIYNVNHELP